MSERAYVELPVLQWLSGHGTVSPAETGLGWTYRDEAAMVEFGRPLEDPLVERLLVNGIPLVIAEYKSYVATREDWCEGVRQLHRYQRQAPLMLAPNVFCVSADGQVGCMSWGNARSGAIAPRCGR